MFLFEHNTLVGCEINRSWFILDTCFSNFCIQIMRIPWEFFITSLVRWFELLNRSNTNFMVMMLHNSRIRSNCSYCPWFRRSDLDMLKALKRRRSRSVAERTHLLVCRHNLRLFAPQHWHQCCFWINVWLCNWLSFIKFVRITARMAWILLWELVIGLHCGVELDFFSADLQKICRVTPFFYYCLLPTIC